VVRQDNGAAIHSKLPGLCQHGLVRIIMLWKPCGAVQASSCVHGRLYLSFCPINLQQVLMSMQMDAEFKRS